MAQDNEISPLPPGTELKSAERTYVIERYLGSGAYGITYQASSNIMVGNIKTSVRFAIKEYFMGDSCYRDSDGKTVLSVPAAKSKVIENKANFLAESNRLKQLCRKSRSIVSVNETFEANGTAYYVMEYLDGGNPAKCDERTAISIVLQLAKALEVIHEEKVLHLDIKPDNVLLKTDEKGETFPVLIDFGLSKHFDEEGRPTSSVKVKGVSTGYAPQEQYAGVSEFSPKYDIYALGAVLFYLCTGKNPPKSFDIPANQSVLRMALEGKVSGSVMKAILNAMKPSAMERTPSIQRFCDDLMGVNFVPVLNVADGQVNFMKGKGSTNLEVESNVEWSAYCDSKWCRITKNGNVLKISVSKNPETSSRTCYIEFTCAPYDVKRIVKVRQEGLGTVIIDNDTSWWDKNKQMVIKVSSIVAASCCVIGLVVLLWTNVEVGTSPETPIATEDTTTSPANQVTTTGGASDAHGEQATQAKQEDSSKLASEESNDTKFARASNDFSLMRSLALDGYAKAYYPLAMMYYNKGDNANAKKWAQKAVSAAVNKTSAQSLLSKINTQAEAASNDKLFERASTISDYKKLADKGYAKAYAPLAALYLKQYDYDNAHNYAAKAYRAGSNLDIARVVVNTLDTYDYYKDGKHTKPNI